MATRCPSARPIMPARSSAEACTKISFPPRSGAIKPNPLLALYHFTVPNSSTVARSRDGYAGRSGRGRRGGSCDAVLASTLMISVTCGPFGPGLVRTSSVAPGGTLLALSHAYMQEGIAGAIRELHEAEPLLGIVPLDGGADGWTGRCFELRPARRSKSEISSRRFVVVVVETTAGVRAIPVSVVP